MMTNYIDNCLDLCKTKWSKVLEKDYSKESDGK